MLCLHDYEDHSRGINGKLNAPDLVSHSEENVLKIRQHPKVAIIGYGTVGQAYHKMFPDAVIYDEPKDFYVIPDAENDAAGFDNKAAWARSHVNQCDLAIVCVWTAHTENGALDMSIVEEVVGWIDTPLILIKSALHPGTTDKLVRKTGKKIAVSVEFIGEGSYFIPPWKFPDVANPTMHPMLIVGGAEETAEACAEILWNRMSPDINIRLTSALEAEMVKLLENSWGALKVTFMNTVMSLAQKTDVNFIRMHQAWRADPRTESMHLRAVSFNRGWVSKCFDKDVPALVAYARSVGAEDLAVLFETILKLNEEHLKLNGKKD